MWGAERPVDARLAPTGAKRRPRSAKQSVIDFWRVNHYFNTSKAPSESMQLYVRKQFPFSLSAVNFIREYKRKPGGIPGFTIGSSVYSPDQRKAFHYLVVTRFVLLQYEVPPFRTTYLTRK